MTINLADLNATKPSELTFDLELLHPVTDEPLGLFIQVVGSSSERVRKLRDEQVNELLKADFEKQRNKGKAPTIDVAVKKNAKLSARATVGWYEQQPVTVGEKPKKIDGLPFGDTRIEFSEDAAIQLYSDPAYDWLYQQVDKAVGDLSNFMKP